ncbi:ATP-dependent zinc protease [Photobacterium lucens]|uniref:ATP-dependent zinc protease family protein n=1 Tax=Photobacterium lucens TaxID=2562949 RepID=UPI000D177718|nr:RimK/LysX family protein [Photobacterium lucens]MBP2701096.1 hypothetical protein [Vibrio parahaemolyticus]MZG57776.1 hypothetical protein [Photobacterium lucens]MZG81977.1 hypothetical protein [Photobacterium lucens]PSV22154.1 hypothetical protein C0W44_07355 [Photobacterium leiognathi subsp. mandapamensis]
MKNILISAVLLLASGTTFAAPQCDGKSIVGPVETIQVKDLGISYKARIDTGANTTSINAYDIKVDGKPDTDDSKKAMYDNLGHMVTFKTKNELGQEVSHTAKIIKVSKIRNAQGVERRYAVVMDLIWNGQHKAIPVNLRDRSKLEYKLLIGRNWLANDYLVDVTKNDEDD